MVVKVTKKTHSTLPMTIEEVQDKFRDLSPKHDEKNRKEVFDAIDNLENASIDDLLTPLRKQKRKGMQVE